MNKIGTTLTSHPKKILSLIFIITGLLFYYAFLSENKLRVDFSLEQMFPENDPEKEIYDSFREKFPREDDVALLIYVPPVHPLNIESLKVIDSVVYEIRDIQSQSNCISLKNFPCKNIKYNNEDKIPNAGEAYFVDYVNDTVLFRVSHYFNEPKKYMIRISGLSGDNRIDEFESSDLNRFVSESGRYSDFLIPIDQSKSNDLICFEDIKEYSSEGYKNINIENTPYYMVEGCNQDDNQKIFSLPTLKERDELVFPIHESCSNNDKVYYYDSNNNAQFDCEPFGCGNDGICSPYFYESLGLDYPESYVYPGKDTNEWDDSRYDFELSLDDYSDGDVFLILGDSIDENYVNEDWGKYDEYWDCEDFLTVRKTGEEYIKNHPFYNNLILSNSGQVGGILVNLDDRIQGQDTRAHFFKKLDKIISKNEIEYNWQWHDGGIPVLRTRYVELVHKERNTFIPLAFLVVTLILLFVFRQIKSIVLPISTMSVALIWVSALMAFLSISINIVSYLTYNLLLIIGCSNAIHIQMKYHEGLFAGKSKVRSLREVISRIGGALFLTSFTTSVGFFSLFMTNIRLTREFGLILGVGVFIMFFMMIIVLPLLLLITKTPTKKMSKRLIKGGSHGIVVWLNGFINKYPKRIAVSSILIFVIAFIGLMRIDYNVSILDDLKPTNQLYQDIRTVEGNMGGVFPLEVMVNFKNPINKDSTNLSSNIMKIDSMKNKISNLSKVTSANAVSDIIFISDYYDIYEAFREFENNPEARISKGIRDFVSDDLKTLRISGRMVNVKADEAKNIKESITKFSEELFGDSVETVSTGSTFLALKTADHLVTNLTNSFVLAFIIIFISMIFLFKSFRLSLISILPNIIPLMFAAAVMGFQDIKLRPTTAMTFAIALGIAVDDTIHFLARFRQEYAKFGDIQQAIKKTLETTGKAIISTTIVLSLGFAVLYFSELMPNHEFGILATIILSVALIGSILLLPALLVLFKPKLKVPKNDSK